MAEQEALECSVALDLLTFMLYKLHFYIILYFCVSPSHYLCLSGGVCLHYRQFSSCCLSFPTPVSCRDWRDFPQTQPCLDLESETAPCSSVYSAVSQPHGIKNESFCPKQGMKSVWPIPQAPCVPLMQISLSVRLWVLVLPADG